ncbi:MAG TPA: prolipoprotein diacylglyceryl transferase family protein [Solirubrobacteraceae bacterium]|nr:prolipoprotein diacylglyceryl transferase family protein [Solirubrobacteraceae bacterium]
MQPEIDVLGLSLKTFGLMFALGFLASGAIISRRLRELGKPEEWAYEMVFAALLGGLVGARLYWAFQHWSEVTSDPVGGLFGGTGLVWYGGALGGAAAMLAWAAWRGFLGLTLLDVCAVPLAIGYAIGRLGCQLSGDGDYGKAWDGPWAMAYPDGTVPTEQTVHPTPIYETLAMVLVAWALWRLRDRLRPGLLFALYLVLAGIERFLVEFLRRNAEAFAGLTQPQLESLLMVAAGAVWLLVAHRRGGIERADAQRPQVRPATPARPAARTAR